MSRCSSVVVRGQSWPMRTSTGSVPRAARSASVMDSCGHHDRPGARSNRSMLLAPPRLASTVPAFVTARQPRGSSAMRSVTQPMSSVSRGTASQTS
ncbi:MAG: hypothetical protein EAS51_10480 [Microbacteriaceae bacterium]|nr:MAG: hypothetical protein EAS51_10480 [Microbacteriaceae bacterium]